MSSSYRTRINKLLSHLTLGSRIDCGKRRSPQQRGHFIEFLESRQLLSVSPADTTVAGIISHAPFNFSNVTFQVNSGNLTNIEFTSLPANGTLTFNGSPVVANTTDIPLAQLANLTYTANAGTGGADVFQWDGSDDAGSTFSNSPANLTLNVNHQPTLGALNASDAHGHSLTIAPSQFTGAFSDADSGDTLQSITFVTLPAHGTLKLNGNNVVAGGSRTAAQFANDTLTYTANASYTGPDSFTWNASDGLDKAAANATFSLSVTDAAPTLSNISLTLGHNQTHTFTAADFTSKFTDADGDTLQSLTIAAVPGHGSLTLGNTTVTNNTPVTVAQIANLVYTPTAGYSGADSFTWNASDGALSAASDATVALNVLADSAPVIQQPFFDTVVIHTSHTFTLADFDPTGNGSGTTRYTDADHNPLVSITVTSLPVSGTLTLNGAAVVANQTISAAQIPGLVYTPTAATQTADFFSFTASDGTLSSAPGQFILAVLDPSAQKVANLTVTTGENRSHTILASDFASKANSTLGFPLPPTTLKIITLPSHGTLTSGGAPLAAGQIINVADVTYTPASGFTGADSFTWTESPDNNVHFATPGSVNITVAPPTDTAFSKFAAQNAVNTFTAAEFSSHFAAPDNGTFFGIQITKLPTNGVLNLGGTPVAPGQIISAANIPSLTYTPKAGYTGADSFLWAGGDGVAIASPVAVDITVLPALSVIGNGALIQQNAKPSVVNFTDFRNWTIAADPTMGADTRSFTVRNSSTSDMSFSGISSIGTNKNDFRIIGPDRARLTNGAFVLAPGDSATFQVQFLPLGIGLRSSVIALRNAAGAVVYQFAVQGNAVASRSAVTTDGQVKGLVQVATTRNGSGPAATNGHIVSIKYTGYLASSGFVFDASANHPETAGGFEFRLDDRFTADANSQPFLHKDPSFNALSALGIVDINVIPGWEFGLQGIKAGEKRTLIINSNAGYGGQGTSGIPGGATLVFDVECVLVDPPPTIVMATLVPGTDSNGKPTTFINKIVPGQTATSASSGTLLSLSNNSSSSSLTQTFNFFTLAADDINGNILANVTFNKKALTITGGNWPDFSNATFTTNQFGPAVQVTFHPLTTGLKTIQIHVNSNDSQHPDYNFTVQGAAARYTDIAAGFDGSLNLPAKPITSGSGQTVPVAVTITNSGDIRLPGHSITNVQIYAHNVTTGALTLVGYINNINISGLGAGAFRIFTPQIALPLDNKSPFSKFSAGTYTFTAVVNQANITANASISGLVALPPRFATMVEADGSASKMIDNNTSDSATATINTRKPVNRGITVIAGRYVLGGSLDDAKIVASPATGAHGSITINVRNLGNIQTIPTQTLKIDLFARPIADNSLPTVTLLSNHAVSAGRIGVGGSASISLPISYNGDTRFRHTTYVLVARVRLVDAGGNIIGGQQVVSLDRHLNAVLIQA